MDLVNAPGRLLKPLKRIDSKWEEIDLDQAYDEIAEKTKKIQKKWGDRAMGVCDVRLSAIARQADEFIQVQPGTDGALALGIARQLIDDNTICHDFIEDYTHGFEAYTRYVKQFTPERVEKDTGIPAETVVHIAREIGKSRPRVAIYVGNGLEHHENGINNVRAVACLDGLLGNLDEEGGNFIPEEAGLQDLTLYEEKPLRHLEPIGAEKFPVLYDFRQECHTMTAMDTILTGKPYPLKGMILAGANPALTNPNTRKVIKALKALDLFVVRELFMTETAELADYVLPAATYLEHSEIHCHPVHQIIGLSPEIVTFPECDYDYLFWKKLAMRLEAGDYFPWKDEDALNNWILKDTGITREKHNI